MDPFEARWAEAAARVEVVCGEISALEEQIVSADLSATRCSRLGAVLRCHEAALFDAAADERVALRSATARAEGAVGEARGAPRDAASATAVGVERATRLSHRALGSRGGGPQRNGLEETEEGSPGPSGGAGGYDPSPTLLLLREALASTRDLRASVSAARARAAARGAQAAAEGGRLAAGLAELAEVLGQPGWARGKGAGAERPSVGAGAEGPCLATGAAVAATREGPRSSPSLAPPPSPGTETEEELLTRLCDVLERALEEADDAEAAVARAEEQASRRADAGEGVSLRAVRALAESAGMHEAAAAKAASSLGEALDAWWHVPALHAAPWALRSGRPASARVEEGRGEGGG